MTDIVNIRNNINNYYKNKKEEYLKHKQKTKRDRYSKYYGSKQWHDLRNRYYSIHPICEVCERQGLIRPADHIHHKKRFLSGINETAKWRLLLNPTNLLAVCERHHKYAHEYMNKYNTDTADIEEIIQYEEELNNIMTVKE